MKQLISLLLLCCALGVHAQNSEWKLKLSHSGVREDVCIYEIYQTEERCKTRLIESGDSTVVLIDSLTQQVLVMNENRADAEIYNMRFEDISKEEVGARLLPDGVEYHLLPEKKMIHGLLCQRMELLYEGVVKGYGWVALGCELIALKSNFVQPLTVGQLVEFDLETDGLVTHCELLDYRSGVTYPDGFFSPDLKKVKGFIIKD